MFVRQRQLDFLRGVAATYVVVNHTRGAFYVGGKKLLSVHPTILNKLLAAALQLTSLGGEMVMLFFVLSGFAMAHSMSTTKSVGRFYLKRVIRIWPPYVAACLWAYAIARILGLRIDLLPMVTYVRVSSVITPQFWSLPYEVIFYALCPLLLTMRTRWLVLIAVVGTGLTVVARGPLLNPWPYLPENFFGTELLIFTIGVVAYRHYEQIPRVNVLYILLALPFVWLVEHSFRDMNIFSILFMAVLTVLAIRNLPDEIPSWANLGSFSYSIYIFHYAAVYLLFEIMLHGQKSFNPLLWLIFVPPVIGCCYLLYLVTERPCNLVLQHIRISRI